MDDKDDKILVTRSAMPDFDEYVEMIRPLWESRWLTNSGTYHRELERLLKAYLGVEELVLTVNGHMALELALQSMNLAPGSEVITTPFTFISTTNAIVRSGLKPVFCDIKPSDYTIDEEQIERLITPKTAAIMPVHVYGNLCNVEAIGKIAADHGLKVLYDAAHAFGEDYRGRGIGSFGDMSVFSFHATKVYHTIEGGAISCNVKAKEQYEKLNSLKNFGLVSETRIGQAGGNGKMNEFAAAMGICNLKNIQRDIDTRKTAVLRYRERLGACGRLRLNSYAEGLTPNYAYMPVLFETGQMRDDIYEYLKSKEIFARKYFYPLTVDAAYFVQPDGGCERSVERSLPVARDISDRILVLPLFSDITNEQVDRVCDCITERLG